MLSIISKLLELLRNRSQTPEQKIIVVVVIKDDTRRQ